MTENVEIHSLKLTDQLVDSTTVGMADHYFCGHRLLDELGQRGGWRAASQADKFAFQLVGEGGIGADGRLSVSDGRRVRTVTVVKVASWA
ncbi:MAG: hypothetical protein ACREP9_12545 [Candidatus Dormibacteraceae bacterium]